jgi:hypothetical protein
VKKTMTRLILTAALAVAAIFLPAAATSSSAAPTATLSGVVGPGFTITLKNADGSAVTHLDPGAYTISIDDQSTLHNYHLSGPGVEMRTDIETTGMATWNVTIQDGIYAFRCDAHPLSMKGSFTAGAVQPPPPAPGKLSGRVTARAITLKNAAGAKVKALTEGTYKVTVKDASKAQNFHLTGPGVNRKTKVRATPKVTWTLDLTPGKYTYRSDKKKRLKGTFTVRPSVPPVGG